MHEPMVSHSSAETALIGEQLGRTLRGGEVICLTGELGAGKTVLAKGLAKGLGLDDNITSPTFTLIQEYSLKRNEPLQFIHMDLYRLNHPEEAEVVGVPDYFRRDCICLIEWPQIIEDILPDERLEIMIEGSGDMPRLIRFRCLPNKDKR